MTTPSVWPSGRRQRPGKPFRSVISRGGESAAPARLPRRPRCGLVHRSAGSAAALDRRPGRVVAAGPAGITGTGGRRRRRGARHDRDRVPDARGVQVFGDPHCHRHLGVRHGVDVGLGDPRLPRPPRRADDRPDVAGGVPRHLPLSRREARPWPAPPCWPTRTTSVPASSPTSSSASTGGRTSACADLERQFGVTIERRSFRELAAPRRRRARRRGSTPRRAGIAAERADGRTGQPEARADALRLYSRSATSSTRPATSSPRASTASTSRRPHRPHPAWRGTCCSRNAA